MKRTHLALLLAAAAVLVTGCSAPSAPADTATRSAPTVTSTPSPIHAKSERGNLIKNVGDRSGVTGDNGDQIGAWWVQSIEIDPACTGPAAKPSENGHLVALTIDVETTPELTEGIFFGLGAWSVVQADGTTANGEPQTLAAYSCFGDTERLPDSVGPGEKARGIVVLDVPTDTGVIVFKYAGGGWEWKYPQ